MNMGFNTRSFIVVALLFVLVFISTIPQLYGQSANVVPPEMNLIGTENVSDQKQDNTVRVDPLQSLKYYRGGFNITNPHYWSSTFFTGIPGYAFSLLWLLCGLGYGLFLLCTTYCLKNSRKPNKDRHLKNSSCHPRRQYLWHFLFGILFTILAITAAGVVLGGNDRLHSRTKMVADLVIDMADEGSQALQNTSRAMKAMISSSNLEETTEAIGAEAIEFLNSSAIQLESVATYIQTQAKTSRLAVHKGLDILHTVTIVTISINLVILVVLLLLGPLKFRRALLILTMFCWFLTALYLFFFGVYFSVGNFSGDTCTALEDFRQDPYNNSLSPILPCDQLRSAQSVLSDVSAGIYNVVDGVNANIASMTGNTYYQFCNPFSSPPEYNYQPQECSPQAFRLEDIPQILREITCVADENENCDGRFPIDNIELNRIEGYAKMIQTLVNVYPSMESLVECRVVKDTFSEILNKHCKPLKRDVHMVWASMACLSIIMVVLVLTWVIGAYRARKHHGLVEPRAAATTFSVFWQRSSVGSRN